MPQNGIADPGNHEKKWAGNESVIPDFVMFYRHVAKIGTTKPLEILVN